MSFPPYGFLIFTTACAGGNPSENLSKSPHGWQGRQAPNAARSRACPAVLGRSAPAVPAPVVGLALPFGFTLLLLLLPLPEQHVVLDAGAALAAGGRHA